MRKQTKKGFTIVELVIVIALIAILAAVLIPTFSNVINNAHESNDTVMVKNLNTILNAEELNGNRAQTMQEAIDQAKEGGYNVDKLTPTSTGDIVWDQESNRFVLINAKGQVVFKDESVTGEIDLNSGAYKLWKITKNVAGEKIAYSLYLDKNYTGSDLADLQVKAGLDVGEHTDVTKITYTGETAAKNVTFVTSGMTALEISGYVDSADADKGDVISHYGEAGNVTVNKVANASYHIYGEVKGEVVVKQGHVAVETGAKLYQPIIIKESTGDVKVSAKETVSVVVESTATSSVVVESEKTVYIDDMANKVENKPSNAVLSVEVSSESSFETKESFEILKANGMTDANANVLNGYYKLVSDITVEHLLYVKENTTAVIDLNGHTINSTFAGFVFGNWGTLIINDSGKGSGRVYNSSKDSSNGKFAHDCVRNFGNLTINDGTFGDSNDDKSDVNDVSYGNAVRNMANATCVLNGGNYTALDNYGKWSDNSTTYAYVINNFGKMTINYANIYGKMNGGIACNAGEIVIYNADVSVTGSSSYGVFYLGTVNGNIVVYGGTYSKSGNDKYFAGWDIADKDYREITEGNALHIYGGTFTYNGSEWEGVIKKA